MGLLDALLARCFVQRLTGHFVELGQFAVETVGFRQLQHAAGQVQPDQHALHARALLGQVFGLLLVAWQLQSFGFFGQQVRQPFAQLGRALAIAAGVAAFGPAALQQPQRGFQRQQAPAGLTQFFGELRRCGLAHPSSS